LIFFLLELQPYSSERVILEMVPPCRILVVVQITSFLPSAKGLEFLLFDRGTGALLQS
jgi:hypothetical protein